PKSQWQLCVLHAVRDSLNKVRKGDQQGVAELLQAVYKAESLEEAEEALKELRARWGEVGNEGFGLAGLSELSFCASAVSLHQLSRLCKGVKKRTKAVEIFVHEGAVEKLLYPVLSGLNERLLARRLRGFAEIVSEKYHAIQPQYTRHYVPEASRSKKPLVYASIKQ
ncbi:MAG: transposase, partial [Methanomassiliicoccales archaeon]|nr:transposase [Methanomassiliicoccales archaeon]